MKICSNYVDLQEDGSTFQTVGKIENATYRISIGYCFFLSAQESAQGIISSFVFGAICNEDAHRVLNGPRNPDFISL